MPVRFDSYDEDAGRMELDEGSNAYAILAFLAERPDRGFTPAEIHEGTDVPYGSVGPTLRRLESRDLVRHKEPYWAIGAEEQLARYAAMTSTVEAIERRYGAEDADDWLPDADRTGDE